MNLVLMIIGAFFITYMLVPQVAKLAFKIGAIDKPNHRKVHSKIMPRLGGLAIYLGFTVMVLLTQELTSQIIGLILGSSIIVAIGVLDDVKDISPKIKLLGQILAALVLALFGVDVDFITHPIFGNTFSLGYFSLPVTIFWVVGITNAVNLIDGLDGLAGGVSTIAALILAAIGFMHGELVMASLALILAASTIGFLRYNFFPATIFMGDSGSMFLGFNLAAFSMMGLTKSITVISVFVPILIIGIPIFDTLFAIVRRFINNQPIFKADKEHLHHCLLNKGLSHKQTVLTIYGINIFLGVVGILLSKMTTNQGMLILAFVSLFILWGAQKIGVMGKRKTTEQLREKVAEK
ncbi:UDP-GlcNAc:undecaprenyl-phosphate GlcNAc-1-phosphate transferase [Desulfonispora thiosulfatigenes DSM 11270]|uniref:UDP-GlcNAc:undecaprenyl-phosphate GlcNAc-1-phosphate transferase n=1 Tax=Desulfonispora thiosulfatigenes DSM 11270 TaxID=656914 RepID=A0A1W1V595_DESTI|nr:MraY family glycosyltransferase [Desulfonispora thiosulfatigenes]SMB88486.1 UDP-GlcNAc:undecaprenyl-phosphate GlcNAc-1-phosphate transferase [Desulfonispora thiosulfatigenes DSM 11270]